jgi:plastocyanin
VRAWFIAPAAIFVALAFHAASAVTGTVRGSLPQPGVVWVSDGSPPPPPVEVQMSNSGKAFLPGAVVVPAGSSVRFPNEDPFFHSIYSESDADPFDIGFYDTGPGKVVAFPKAGVVAVRCHIHGFMHGTILIVDGPWVVTSQPDQSYEIQNVRPGKHILHVWTPADGEKTSEVSV